MDNEQTENILLKVKEFTDQAHGDQTRKYTPDRYIVHPERVMRLCQKYTDDIAMLSAALLHDVLEDTKTTKDEIFYFLRELMGEAKARQTVNLVSEMTDVYIKQTYPRYNRRRRKRMEAERMEKTSADAQTIKYADIIDNCNEIVDHDPDFAKVFLDESRRLLEKIPAGNGALREKAIKVVNGNLELLKKNGITKTRV